jgi:purine catabolism regulator
MYSQGFILRYDELGIYKVISEICSEGDVSKYIPQSILKLIKSDKSKSSMLLNTLSVFIKNNQHIKLTANELFIHPKTVSYRLDQIKEIGSIDLKNTDELLEIQFALKILMFQEKQLRLGR